MVGQFSAIVGPKTTLDRRGPSCSSDCTKNQPRRQILRPFRSYVKRWPGSRLPAKVCQVLTITGAPDRGSLLNERALSWGATIAHGGDTRAVALPRPAAHPNPRTLPRLMEPARKGGARFGARLAQTRERYHCSVCSFTGTSCSFAAGAVLGARLAQGLAQGAVRVNTLMTEFRLTAM